MGVAVVFSVRDQGHEGGVIGERALMYLHVLSLVSGKSTDKVVRCGPLYTNAGFDSPLVVAYLTHIFTNFLPCDSEGQRIVLVFMFSM